MFNLNIMGFGPGFILFYGNKEGTTIRHALPGFNQPTTIKLKRKYRR